MNAYNYRRLSIFLGSPLCTAIQITNNLRDAMIERLRGAGIQVNDNIVDGQRILDEANGRVAMMGSKTLKKKNDIIKLSSHLDLSPEQKIIIDVFVGKKNHQYLNFDREDGSSVRLEMVEGDETKGGTRHVLFRHFGTGKGVITITDILNIPEILKNGDRSIAGNKVGYKLLKNNKVLSVITEERGNKEVFVSLYSDINLKNSLSASKNTNLIARSTENDFLDAAKIQQNFDINKENDENYRDDLKKQDVSDNQQSFFRAGDKQAIHHLIAYFQVGRIT